MTFIVFISSFESILGLDKVMLMENGELIEEGKPRLLILDKKSKVSEFLQKKDFKVLKSLVTHVEKSEDDIQFKMVSEKDLSEVRNLNNPSLTTTQRSFFKRVDEYSFKDKIVLTSDVDKENGRHLIRKGKFHTLKEVITRPQTGYVSPNEEPVDCEGSLEASVDNVEDIDI